MAQKTYKETIADLYQLQQFSVKQGLENITALAENLDNPHRAYPVIHIAGTNGKGSTSSILQKILTAHGLKVGLYTSPHLIDFRERITVNTQKIERDYITGYWQRIAPTVLDMRATFFDTTTALAFKYFRDRKVDVAVIETGLGGRLDSTNIVQPEGVIITPIHRDHTKQLGYRLAEITSEKAEIIKQGTTVFCAQQHKHVRDHLTAWQARARNWYDKKKITRVNVREMTATGSVFDIEDKLHKCNISGLKLPMSGLHQVDNAVLAYLAAHWYIDHISGTFSDKSLKLALIGAIWPGRFQRISDNPQIIFDVSHNYDGFRKTLKLIETHYRPETSHLLIGLIADKEYDKIAHLIYDKFASIIVTEPSYQRALPAEKLQTALKRLGKLVVVQRDFLKAYELAKRETGADEALFVMGSHYLIGALLAGFHKRT